MMLHQRPVAEPVVGMQLCREENRRLTIALDIARTARVQAEAAKAAADTAPTQAEAAKAAIEERKQTSESMIPSDQAKLLEQCEELKAEAAKSELGRQEAQCQVQQQQHELQRLRQQLTESQASKQVGRHVSSTSKLPLLQPLWSLCTDGRQGAVSCVRGVAALHAFGTRYAL